MKKYATARPRLFYGTDMQEEQIWTTELKELIDSTPIGHRHRMGKAEQEVGCILRMQRWQNMRMRNENLYVL